ncbi:hypothetical protein [Pseudovibrio sp. SPO723]|uniref:ATP-binding protein n=1 Tax=Nesiotobacter zosterae TaxID=392721 RepID=UPI0029C5580E|nr:hypothetical protein [Pseudovibrio sp. SPO723]MDX5593301.1 hypothetical protein [Pseudovibrio sp. SPO723]
MTADRHRILLLGNYRPTLTLVRTLGAAGHHLTVGLEGSDGGAEFSRHANATWDHPSLLKDEDAFLTALEAYVARNQITLLFPVSEEFVTCFVRHRQRVEALAPVAMMEPELVSACLDKVGMMQRCVRLQVPCAPFALARSAEELQAACDTLGFPLVVRPELSTQRLGGKKAVTLHTAQDVGTLVALWHNRSSALVLQQHFSGRRYNLYFAAEKGVLTRHVQAVILRTDSPDGSGLAVEGETIPPLEPLRTYTMRLIADLEYDGIGCAQYLVEERTGAISFLEINARIAGNLNVPEAAGLALGPLLVNKALGVQATAHPAASLTEGRTGMRYVWVSGELLAAIVAQMKGEIGFATMVKRFGVALGSAFRADLHMVWSWKDPLPALVTLWRLMPSLSGVKRRLKKLFFKQEESREKDRQVSP